MNLQKCEQAKLSNVRMARVAAVQMDCAVGQSQRNRRRAAIYVEEAAECGAQLVLLPELMPGGYRLTEEIWQSAEVGDGPTVQWLKELGWRYGIYVGTSFLEADGDDFYNTFVLATPHGNVAGRVRKSPPASLEACFYRAGSGCHVIETDLGRIGVLICYENLLFARLFELYQQAPDLILQPMAAGRPRPMRRGDLARFDAAILRCSPYYPRVLGTPVVMSDRCGKLDTPLPGGAPDLHSTFPGFSAIVDSDGTVKARLGETEGIAVADVRLDPVARRRIAPRPYQEFWAFRLPWFAFIYPETQRQGEQMYAASAERRRLARHMSR